MSFGKHAAIRSAGNFSAGPGVSPKKHFTGFTTFTEPQFFKPDDLIDWVGIIDLGNVNVGGCQARLFKCLPTCFRKTEPS
jgi:hypothetical protein